MNLTGGLALMCALAITEHPVEIEGPLKNPHKGWVFIDHAVTNEIDAGQSAARVKDGTVYEWYENVAVLSTWALVEPAPGQFDWSLMDKSIDAWSKAGKRIHLRFATDDFGIMPGCPRWLFDLGVPKTVRNHQMFPDYNHPVYQERLGLFLKVFAGRFADDLRIETVNLQGYGDFGEWHSGANFDSVEDRVKALKSIVEAWRRAFNGRKLLNLSSSYEWMTRNNVNMDIRPLGTSIYEDFRPSYRDYLHRSVFDYAYAQPDVTLARHGCAGAVFQEYDGRLMSTFFQHWRKPMFMEFFGGIDHYTGPSILGFPGTKEGDNFVGNALDELVSHHPTFATPLGWGSGGGAGGDKGSATHFYNDYRDQMLRYLRLIGYQYVLVETSFPESIAPGAIWGFRHRWENRAMGRCYKQYPLAVYLVRNGRVAWEGRDLGFDQRAFVAGETYECQSKFELPRDIEPGNYELLVAMVDEAGAPALNLAIEGDDGQKRYRVGTLAVTADAGTQGGLGLEPLAIARQKTKWTSKESLASNSTYLIHFKYNVARSSANDLDTDDPGYCRFYAEGSDGTREDEIRWFDKAGQPPARKTAIVNTAGAESYTLVWESVGGDMEISDVLLEAVDWSTVRRVVVNSDDIKLNGRARIDQQVRVLANREKPEITLPDDYYDFLETNPDKVSLKPNTTYSVWFYSATRPQLWQADYHYCSLRSQQDPAIATRQPWRWTQRFTSNPVRHCYTFTTGPANDYRLVWGIHNGGEGRVSRITVLERSGQALGTQTRPSDPKGRGQ